MDWLQSQSNRLRRHPLLALIFGVFLGWALENLFSQTLARAGIGGVAALLLIIVAAIAFFNAARALLNHLFPAPKILVGFPPSPQRALILLFSNEKTFAKAIQHHQPRLAYLWLVVTPEATEKARHASAQLPGIEVAEQPVRTPWNPDDTALAIRRAVEHAKDLELASAEIICDVTGGTKPMTIGAAVACMALDLKVQMVAAKYDAELSHPETLEVIEVRLV